MGAKSKTTTTTEYPSVRVRWEDAATYSGWTDEGRYETISVDTHGYLIEHTPDRVSIAPSFTDNGLYGDLVTVPLGCVKEIVRTEDGKKIKKHK